MNGSTDTYDYIVVGGGAAGCTIAGRLAENSANRVIVLEAGGPDSNPFFAIPGLLFVVGSGLKYSWNFMTEPVAALGNRQIKILHGKVLGGSSSINGMQYTRGNPGDYNDWRDRGCPGWGFEDVLPYFKKAESSARGPSRFHGTTGPLRTRQPELHLPISSAFLAAASEVGYPVLDDLNGDVDEGFGYSDFNIGGGRRISAATAYLRSSGRRANLTVLTSAEAVRVVIENGKARGVEYVQNGARKTVWCEREVVVSAGAIKSPHLLMLSGIGPADHLREFGIQVAADSPKVGTNLQNHACYRPAYICAPNTTSYRYLKPANAARAAIDYLLFHKGALAESAVAAGGFFRSTPNLPVPNIQVTFITGLLRSPSGTNPSPWQMLPREDGISITVHLQPHSRGEVRLKTPDPLAHPKVDANYFSDPRDLPELMKGVQRFREIMRARAIRPLIEREVLPGDGVNDDTSLEAEIRKNAANSYHPCGTCAMGGDASSVVDPELRVRGIEGLRVADASVMPTIPNAGLHAPSIMVGEKAAAMILGASGVPVAAAVR